MVANVAIISNNIIKATRVILPINSDIRISGKYGLRHRAAVSITEKTDAVAIVVSEENGNISVSYTHLTLPTKRIV